MAVPGFSWTSITALREKHSEYEYSITTRGDLYGKKTKIDTNPNKKY